MLIDYDEIDEWAPHLEDALRQLLPDNIEEALTSANPRYIEDARALLLELAGPEPIVDASLAWLRAGNVVGYHGSRLTSAENASIRSIGLIPLRAEARRERLIRALSQHARWPEVVGRLDEVLHSHGPGCEAGKREGQVHLTLSKGGLTEGFNHYLEYGAEFDYHAAQELLGEEGQALLTRDGNPVIIRVAVPGAVALEAAHPYFSADDLRERGEVPNIVGDFLAAWSFRLVRPKFQPRTLVTDCGMIFFDAVPAKWIIGVDPWRGQSTDTSATDKNPQQARGAAVEGTE